MQDLFKDISGNIKYYKRSQRRNLPVAGGGVQVL
jgi:hypothetical protein